MNREQLQKVRDALSEGCGWSDQILADYDEKYARHPATEADREFITDSQNKIIEALDILDRALAAPEQEPVAWGMPNAGGLIMDVISPEEHFREEGGYTVPLYRHPAPQSQPIARVTGYYAGRCVIEPLDGKTVFSSGMAVYSAPVAAQEVPPMQWIDVSERVPDEAQIVLFVLRGKVVVGAWIAGIFWYDNAKQVATAWMPLPPPPEFGVGGYPVTAPPSREWQGLTDDDRIKVFNSLENGLEGFLKTWGWLHFAKAIEAALKDKNHG